MLTFAEDYGLPAMEISKGKGLKRTPLYEVHLGLGAKIVQFAGWEMPIQYSGIIDEHLAVRNCAGLFDVSHMGEIEISGQGALSALQRLLTNDVTRLSEGEAQYSLICYPNGCTVDDLTVYRTTNDLFMLCVNAANAEKDFLWIKDNLKGKALARDISDETTLLALQGQKAEQILRKITMVDLSRLGYFKFLRAEVGGVKTTLSRTGYTGEDGFELFAQSERAQNLWAALMEAGAEFGLKPIGLGARDTLRMEMKYPLYGHELDENTTPIEACLNFAVRFEKGDFIGRDVLLKQSREGVSKKLIGFEIVGKGIARRDYKILKDGLIVGRVTSGTMSPSLKKPIGLGYVRPELADPGTELDVEIRGEAVKAIVHKSRFYPSKVRR